MCGFGRIPYAPFVRSSPPPRRQRPPLPPRRPPIPPPPLPPVRLAGFAAPRPLAPDGCGPPDASISLPAPVRKNFGFGHPGASHIAGSVGYHSPGARNLCPHQQVHSRTGSATSSDFTTRETTDRMLLSFVHDDVGGSTPPPASTTAFGDDVPPPTCFESVCVTLTRRLDSILVTPLLLDAIGWGCNTLVTHSRGHSNCE